MHSLMRQQKLLASIDGMVAIVMGDENVRVVCTSPVRKM
jgi:hypothetical protein